MNTIDFQHEGVENTVCTVCEPKIISARYRVATQGRRPYHWFSLPCPSPSLDLDSKSVCSAVRNATPFLSRVSPPHSLRLMATNMLGLAFFAYCPTKETRFLKNPCSLTTTDEIRWSRALRPRVATLDCGCFSTMSHADKQDSYASAAYSLDHSLLSRVTNCL